MKGIIKKGDDELIADLYEVVKGYNESFELPENELNELNRRRERYLSGESKSYTGGNEGSYQEERKDKMMYQIIIQAEANDDLTNAYEWYEEKQPRLGNEILDAG